MPSILPPSPGLLPYFLLYGSFAAIVHSLVTYVLEPEVSLKQFSGPEAPDQTALLAHVYGVKNTYTALIRFYAAYHMQNRELYNLALWSYVGVLVLYGGEIFVWETVGLREGIAPLLTAGLGLFWMLAQKRAYLFAGVVVDQTEEEETEEKKKA